MFGAAVLLLQSCGLVTMSTQAEAVAAMEALNGRYTWAGMWGPMEVKPPATTDKKATPQKMPLGMGGPATAMPHAGRQLPTLNYGESCCYGLLAVG